MVVKKQGESQKNISVREWLPEHKAKLSVIIGQAFDMQKQFGKTTGQLENIVSGFLWIMEPYPVDIVVGAFAKYLREHSDMPTPSDIVKIIDPKKPEKIWDKAVYIKLQKIYDQEGPYGLNEDEYEYIRGYEESVLKTHRKEK